VRQARPQSEALVVTPGAFNRLAKVPIVLPITSGDGFACRWRPQASAISAGVGQPRATL
jgi:hypothetical protein